MQNQQATKHGTPAFVDIRAAALVERRSVSSGGRCDPRRYNPRHGCLDGSHFRPIATDFEWCTW